MPMRLSSWMPLCLQPEAPPAFTPTGPKVSLLPPSDGLVTDPALPQTARRCPIPSLSWYVLFFFSGFGILREVVFLFDTNVGLQYVFPPCRRPKCQLRIQLECNGYCVLVYYFMFGLGKKNPARILFCARMV